MLTFLITSLSDSPRSTAGKVTLSVDLRVSAPCDDSLGPSIEPYRRDGSCFHYSILATEAHVSSPVGSECLAPHSSSGDLAPSGADSKVGCLELMALRVKGGS